VTAPRGRGRPVVFDQGARERFLAALTAGERLEDAARAAGVSRNVPARHAQADRAFAAALTEARATGRKARAERAPHGESRYNHQQCRCPVCRTDATRKRSGRPDRSTSQNPHPRKEDPPHAQPWSAA